MKCTDCNGKGFRTSLSDPCTTCHNSGRVETAIHRATTYTLITMSDDGGPLQKHTSFEVDTPESLGQWALEMGDYHQRSPYCQEITHVDEIAVPVSWGPQA